MSTGSIFPAIVMSVIGLVTSIGPYETARAEGSDGARLATQEEVGAIIKSIQGLLKDPSSAVIDHAKVKHGRYCAELKAKNSYGGYTGAHTITGLIGASKSGGQIAYTGRVDETGAYTECVKAGIYQHDQ